MDNIIMILLLQSGRKLHGAPGDFAPEMQKIALENKKEPSEKKKKKRAPEIAIDCKVKACSMLQI